MPDLTLRISGLCGYVPGEELGTDPNRMTVLLARDKTVGRRSPKFHRPTLAVATSSIQSAPAPSNLPVIENANHSLPKTWPVHNPAGGVPAPATDYTVFDLSRFEVSVKGSASGNNLKVDAQSLGNPPTPTAQNGRSLRWMVPVKSVHPGAETVKDSALSARPGAEVAARLRLTDGSLQAACVEKMDVMEFKNSAGNTLLAKRPLAELTEYRKAFGANDSPTLVLTLLDDPSKTFDLAFKAGADVVCLINNIPKKQVLTTSRAPVAQDKHFPSLYQLSTQPPNASGEGMPTPWPPPPPRQPGEVARAAAQNPQCPGCVFDPHPDA